MGRVSDHWSNRATAVKWRLVGEGEGPRRRETRERDDNETFNLQSVSYSIDTLVSSLLFRNYSFSLLISCPLAFTHTLALPVWPESTSKSKSKTIFQRRDSMWNRESPSLPPPSALLSLHVIYPPPLLTPLCPLLFLSYSTYYCVPILPKTLPCMLLLPWGALIYIFH